MAASTPTVLRAAALSFAPPAKLTRAPVRPVIIKIARFGLTERHVSGRRTTKCRADEGEATIVMASPLNHALLP
jgi:hypothetical protein